MISVVVVNNNVHVLNSCNDVVKQYGVVSKKQMYNARDKLKELYKIVFCILPCYFSAVDNALSGGGAPDGVWRHHHAAEYMVLPG